MTSRVRYEATLSRKEAAAHMRREDDDERRMKNERMQAVRNRGAAAAAVPLEEEFTLDAPLEVMMTEDGFVGSWYPAILREIKTVDDQPSRAPVELTSIQAGLATDENQKEWVSLLQLRPEPPPTSAIANFAEALQPGDPVEMAHEGGWWEVPPRRRPPS